MLHIYFNIIGKVDPELEELLEKKDLVDLHELMAQWDGYKIHGY
jgi:hypothetical protein